MRRLIAFLLLASMALLGAEDPKLRQRANELAQRSIAVTTPVHWPPHTHNVTFQYTASDGTTTDGTVAVEHQSISAFRTETTFGDFYSMTVRGPKVMGGKRNEPLAPPGVREMASLINAYTIRFDKEDVITDIRDSTVQGRPATCVELFSNFGSKSDRAQVCYDKAEGMLLHFQFGSQIIDSTNWVEFAGYWFPQHIEKSEGGKRVVVIDQVFEAVDAFPPETFELPADARSFIWCREYRRPIGDSMPQPNAGAGDHVDDILVQGSITADGHVTSTAIRHSSRPDLEPEALRTAQKWTFHPAMCDGKAIPSSGDFLLHFKGR